MFNQCTNAETITFGKSINTSNVTKMNQLFLSCTNLTTINNIDRFDTSSVTDFSFMFADCKALKDIKIANFDTDSATSLSTMFSGCEKLEILDLSGFTISSSTTPEAKGTKNLKEIYFGENFSGWSSTSGLFELTEAPSTNRQVTIYLPQGTTSESTLYKLVSQYSSENTTGYHWDSDYIDIVEIKYYTKENITYNYSDKNLSVNGTASTRGRVPKLDIDKLTNYYTGIIKSNQSEILTATFSGEIRCAKNSSFQSMFYYCSALTSVIFGKNVDTRNVNSLESMFYNCEALSTVDISHFDTSSVTSFTQMFYSWNSSLTSINVSNFDTSNATYFSSMFANCKNITELNISNFDTSNAISIASLFDGCSGLTEIDVSNFDTSNVTRMDGLFSGCNKLTTIDISNFDTSKTTYMNAMFSGCSSLTEIKGLENFDTDLVTQFQFMFYFCPKIKTLNLSKFDFSSATMCGNFLTSCTSLEKLYVPTNVNSLSLALPTITNAKWYSYDALDVNETLYTASNLPQRTSLIDYLKVYTPYFEEMPNQTYTGSAITPEFTIKHKDYTLIAGTDYDATTILYSDNINVGTCTITVTGLGNYSGTTISGTFDIVEVRKRRKKTTTDNGTEETNKETEVSKEEAKNTEEETKEELTEEQKQFEIEKFEIERFERITKKSHIDKSYVKGYDDNTFKPNETIKRSEVATILATLSLGYDDNTNYDSYKNEFSDLDNKKEWYDNYIGYCDKEGILIGYLDGTFRPEENMTRAEFTVAVKRMYEVIANTYNLENVNLQDIKDEWYEEDILAMASNNYVGGTNNNFNGNNDITRAEACKIINNVINRLELLKDQILVNKYKDVYVTDWYYEDVLGASVDVEKLKNK